MKKLVCSDLGGACDMEISADNKEEMIEKATQHMIDRHPEIAEEMESMTEEEHNDWEKDFEKKWNAAPEAM